MSRRCRSIKAKDGRWVDLNLDHPNVSMTETSELVSFRVKQDDGSVKRYHFDKKDIIRDYEYTE